MTLPIFVKLLVYLSSKIKIFCFLWKQFFLELSRVYQWVVVLNSFTLQRYLLALYMVYWLLVLFSLCKIMMIVVKVILVGLYTKDLWYWVYVFDRDLWQLSNMHLRNSPNCECDFLNDALFRYCRLMNLRQFLALIIYTRSWCFMV